jgi:anti-sigma factor ChrR (cupin superfamily)
MRHHAAHDEIAERAALYALGALTQVEAQAFEDHLAEGCEVCQAEVDGFEEVVGSLGAGEAQEVPPQVRDRLVARISEGHSLEGRSSDVAGFAPQILSVRAAEGRWREMQPGIHWKRLYVDKASGVVTSLVKMMPGTALPRHRHDGVEQFFVLEGDCNVDGHELGPGDFHCAEAGSVHDKTYTMGGTLFLLLAPRDYNPLAAH